MSLTAWRIVKASRVRTAFDGEGARRFGGRWNSAGTRMVYTSGSRSLAILEIVVHLEGATTSLKFKMFPIEFDRTLVEELSDTQWPAGWNGLPPCPGVQALGDEWVGKARKPVLRVPSAIVPGESNFLLNPAHPAFGKIRIGKPADFALDPRLLKN